MVRVVVVGLGSSGGGSSAGRERRLLRMAILLHAENGSMCETQTSNGTFRILFAP